MTCMQRPDRWGMESNGFLLVTCYLCKCRADILQGQGHGTELVWSKSATHSFTASHLITPSTSWTGTLAPSTPEKLAFRAALPALLATGQGSAASKLLGSREVSSPVALQAFTRSLHHYTRFCRQMQPAQALHTGRSLLACN